MVIMYTYNSGDSENEQIPSGCRIAFRDTMTLPELRWFLFNQNSWQSFAGESESPAGLLLFA